MWDGTKKLHIGVLGLSFLFMIIALILFGTAFNKEIMKITIRTSSDGFRSFSKKFDSVVGISKVAKKLAEDELHIVKEKLHDVQEKLREVKEELHNIKNKIRRPAIAKVPSYNIPLNNTQNVFHQQREFSTINTNLSFDIAVHPFNTVNVDSLDDIPLVGAIIMIFVNIIFKLGSFVLFVLLLLAIIACSLYLCEIFGRLFSHAKSRPELCLMEYIQNWLSIKLCVYEIVWTIAVAFILLILLLVYVEISRFLNESDWTNCWLGLMTVEFRCGTATIQVVIASIFAFISIVLNVMDKIWVTSQCNYNNVPTSE